MRAYLQKTFPELKWIFDRAVLGVLACSDHRYRPDAWVDLAHRVLVVECDEKQHAHYDQSCELRRMVELLAAAEGRPLTIIRWNPDEYTKGQPTLHQEIVPQETTRFRRYTALKRAISQSIKEQADGTLLNVQYLFYDEHREVDLHARLHEATADYLASGTAA